MLKCPLCKSEEIEEIERDELDDSLECLLLGIKYECNECENEFRVVASFSAPHVVYE